MYPLLKRKKGVILLFLKNVKDIMKCKLQSVTQELFNKTCSVDQIPLRYTNVVDYGMLAIQESNGMLGIHESNGMLGIHESNGMLGIHESNAPFPVTRH
jgi:hypothetical protein